MLSSTTLFAYAAKLVGAHLASAIAELVLGVMFLAVALGNLGWHPCRRHGDPNYASFRFAARRPFNMERDLGIKAAGLVIVILGFVPAVALSMRAALLVFILAERRAETPTLVDPRLHRVLPRPQPRPTTAETPAPSAGMASV